LSFEYWKKCTIDGADVKVLPDGEFNIQKNFVFGYFEQDLGIFWYNVDISNAFSQHKRPLAPQNLRFFQIVLKDYNFFYH